MAATTRTIKATCLCGDAAHDITLPSTAFPLPAYFCTCNSCRHMTGTLFLSAAFLPPSYEPSSDLVSKLASFNFSDRITQYFCKRCGSTMLAHCLSNTQDSNRTEQWDVITGTLESFDGTVDLKGYEYVQDTTDGGFADFMPTWNHRPLDRWAHDIDKSHQLPLYWRNTPSSSEPNNEPGTRLPAHCKCNAIRFYIARPSAQSTQAQRAWPDLLIPHSQPQQAANPHHPWWLRAAGTKFLAGLCSCTSCRLASGVEITPWAFIPKRDLSLDAVGEVPFDDDERTFASLQWYNSSPGIARAFCAGCGAIVFFAEKFSDAEREKTAVLDVAVGLLGAPEGARVESWLEWWTERLSFREDAVGRAGSLVAGLEKGLEEFADRTGRGGAARAIHES